MLMPTRTEVRQAILDVIADTHASNFLRHDVDLGRARDKAAEQFLDRLVWPVLERLAVEPTTTSVVETPPPDMPRDMPRAPETANQP